MKVLIFLFGIIPIWLGLGVLMGRLLNRYFSVSPLPSKIWGFILSPLLIYAAVFIFADLYNR